MPGRYRQKLGNQISGGGMDRTHRFNTDKNWRGTVKNFFSPQTGISSFEEMWDSTNSTPYPDTNMTANKLRVRPGRLNGTALGSNPGTNEIFRDLYKNSLVGPYSYTDSQLGHCSAIGGRDVSQYWNMALAKSNPNVPIVDLAQFVIELRQYPRILRWRNEQYGKYVAINQIPIQAQFGWAPMFSDMIKLLDIQDKIKRRARELEELRKGPQRQKIMLESISRTERGSRYAAGGRTVQVIRRSTAKAWVVKYHQITVGKGNKPPTTDRTDAVRSALLGHPLYVAWQVMPWSWLIDYFWSVSDFLAGGLNVIPGYQVSKMSVCLEKITHFTHETVATSPLWSPAPFTPMDGHRKSMQRLVGASPRPVLPMGSVLTGAQLGTLASLWIARGPGGISRKGWTKDVRPELDPWGMDY